MVFIAFLTFACAAHAGVLETEAYASPAITYAAPAIGSISYGAESPALSEITKANYAVATPAASYAAPAVSYAAPAVSYAAPAVSYAAPAVAYTAHTVAAAPVSTYAAPAPIAYAAPAPIAYAAPVAKTVVAENYAPAHYDYGYAVNDPHTGDSKSHEESRRGDVVQGRYSLIDSDGTKRVVEYSADAHNGFNAVVHKEPLAAPVGYAAAPAIKIAAPVAYASAAVPAYHH